MNRSDSSSGATSSTQTGSLNTRLQYPSESHPNSARPSTQLTPPPSTCAYDWAARLSYLDPEAQNQFLTGLKESSVGAETLLILGRTAKARGNPILGQKFSNLFQNVIQTPQKRPNLRTLPYPDPWGDAVVLPRFTPSELAWRRALRVLNEADRRAFAAALGAYLSVEIPKDCPAETLRQISTQTQGFLQAGLPLPPRLKIFLPVREGPQQTPGGSYHAETDTLSLPADAGPDSWAHELSHFLLDIADDQNGINNSYFEAIAPDDGPLFNSRRCATWESVSVYAGRCDLEREHTFLAGTHKAAEDPAETLASALEARRGAVLPNTLHLNLLEVHYLSQLQVIKFWAESPDALPETADLTDLDRVAQAFHRELGRDVPAPPRFNAEHSSPQFVQDLRKWIEQLETEVLPQAKVVRHRKRLWAEAFLEALSHRPSLDSKSPPAPWQAVQGLKLEFDSTRGIPKPIRPE